MDIRFKKLYDTDIDNLTVIMERAFDYDTEIHLGKAKGGPEGYDDGSFLRKWALNERASSFCIYLEETLIGAVILWINNDNNNYLGNLFIDVKYESKGIGTKVWNEIEKMYPKTKIWYTDTPIFSHRNHNFYVNKCGFHIIEIKKPKDLSEGSYVLQKIIK